MGVRGLGAGVEIKVHNLSRPLLGLARGAPGLGEVGIGDGCGDL